MYKVHWELFATEHQKGQCFIRVTIIKYLLLLSNLHWREHELYLWIFMFFFFKKLSWHLTFKLVSGNKNVKFECKEWYISIPKTHWRKMEIVINRQFEGGCQSKSGRETKGEKKKVRLVVRECVNELKRWIKDILKVVALL